MSENFGNSCGLNKKVEVTASEPKPMGRAGADLAH